MEKNEKVRKLYEVIIDSALELEVNIEGFFIVMFPKDKSFTTMHIKPKKDA